MKKIFVLTKTTPNWPENNNLLIASSFNQDLLVPEIVDESYEEDAEYNINSLIVLE